MSEKKDYCQKLIANLNKHEDLQIALQLTSIISDIDLSLSAESAGDENGKRFFLYRARGRAVSLLGLEDIGGSGGS